MKIIFVPDDNNPNDVTYALAQNTFYKGKFYDELMFAEIQRDKEGKTTVRWEDEYMTRIPVTSFRAAHDHVLQNLTKHKPHVNGAVYDMEEDEL